MSVKFNADEIFEIAVQIERNGGAFYRSAASHFSDTPMGKIFDDLAVMEDQHVKTFAAMKAEYSAGDPVQISFDPDNQAGLYLQSVADGKVFDLNKDPSSFLKEDTTVEDVLDFAIEVEKESIVFYTSMKEMVPASFGQDKIDDIIFQEVGHVTDLRAQKAALQK